MVFGMKLRVEFYLCKINTSDSSATKPDDMDSF